MIPIIYDKNEVAFTSNGLGRLYDCISCIVTEERNGVYECEFQYPISGKNYSLIQVGRIIAVTHDDTEDVQPFDIIGFDKPIDGIVTFHAVHISYRLRKATTVPTAIEGTPDARSAFLTAEPPNNFNYHFFDEPRYDHVAAADGLPHTVKELLGGIEGSLLDTFGGEFKFDKFDVYLLDARGVPRNITVRYGVNMIEYNDEVDTSEAYSSCIPYWTGGTPVIGDRVDSAGTTPSGRIECVPLDLTDKFKNQPTKAQLESRALKYMTKNNTYLATQSIEISFMPLQDYGLIEPGPPALVYILTADANGGSIPSTTGWTGTGASATKELEENEPYGLLPAPTQTGYALDGWYDDPISGSPVDEYTTMGGSDTTIYAHWIVDTKSTVLYTDGTFIINEPASQRSANIAAHGAVTNEFNAWDGDTYDYVFSSYTDRPWNSVRNSITRVIIGSNIAPTSTAYWFSQLNNCSSMDLSKLNTSNVTNMREMFFRCESLASVDVSSFNTSNVTDMYQMFGTAQNYGALTFLDLSSFDTSSVTNMAGMFDYQGNLKTIFVSGTFIVTQVTASANMFRGCSNIVGGAGTVYSSGSSYVNKSRAIIDGGPGYEGYFTFGSAYTTVLYTDGTLIINEPKAQRAANIAAHGAVTNIYNAFDENVYNYVFTNNNSVPWRGKRTSIKSVIIATPITAIETKYWFYGFTDCTSFDLTKLNTANVTNMTNMFYGCSSLTSLDISMFNTSSVTNSSRMFQGCSALVTIVTSNLFVTSQITTSGNMFNGCVSLVGGAGTAFNSSYIDKTYARIDNPPGNPGYFTAA